MRRHASNQWPLVLDSFNAVQDCTSFTPGAGAAGSAMRFPSESTSYGYEQALQTSFKYNANASVQEGTVTKSGTSLRCAHMASSRLDWLGGGGGHAEILSVCAGMSPTKARCAGMRSDGRRKAFSPVFWTPDPPAPREQRIHRWDRKSVV